MPFRGKGLLPDCLTISFALSVVFMNEIRELIICVAIAIVVVVVVVGVVVAKKDQFFAQCGARTHGHSLSLHKMLCLKGERSTTELIGLLI